MSISTSDILHILDEICCFCIKLNGFTAMESLNQNIKMIYNRGKCYKDKDFFLLNLYHVLRKEIKKNKKINKKDC